MNIKARAVNVGSRSELLPRNNNQAKFLKLLNKKDPCILIASGDAGTGKSLLATYVGLKKLENRMVDKIIVTRPAIAVENEEHGFLPGTIEDKMDPWIRPIMDGIDKFYSQQEISMMVRNKELEVCPLAFMRGRSFENSWIICDEAQNCTPNQLLMLMTRIGENSKLVITGDPLQHDRQHIVQNGLIDLMKRIVGHESDYIKYIEFEKNDIVRHPVIHEVLSLYENDA